MLRPKHHAIGCEIIDLAMPWGRKSIFRFRTNRFESFAFIISFHVRFDIIWLQTGQIVFVEEYCVGINNVRDVIVVKCLSTDPTQLWTYNNEVRTGFSIFFTFVNKKFVKKDSNSRRVLLDNMFFSSQKQWILHRETNLCLQSIRENEAVKLAVCNAADKGFQWTLKSTLPE